MKKGKYLLILVITSTFLCIGQEVTDYAEYYEDTDVLWRKGKVLNGKAHGYWEYYDEKGVLSSTGYWIEGAKDSVWKSYLGKDRLWFIENYKNDKLNGTYIQMDIDGSGYASFKGQYKNDKPTGKWTSYYTSDEKAGKVAYEFELKPMGETAPATRYFYSTDYKDINGKDPYYTDAFKSEGNVKFTSIEENPLENGMALIWFLYINLKINAVYQGNWKYYYKNGQIHAEGTYENGYKQGSWTYYYPNGNKWMVCTYNGGYKSWGVETGPNETITYSRNFRGGPFELYYENGKLKEKGVYTKEEEKIGIWKYYNEDGSLEKTETYIDGVKQ